MKSKKQLKIGYKQATKPMGIFLIRNVSNNRIFVAAGMNLEGALNKHKFQLTAGIHPNTRLQTDWNETNNSNFTFEIVDQLTPVGDSNTDQADLESLRTLWLERLQPFDDRGYNERTISRGEMLSRISARRVKD